jgi:mannose-6-phosphate isomerase-like protein (cupin superfamily)
MKITLSTSSAVIMCALTLTLLASCASVNALNSNTTSNSSNEIKPIIQSSIVSFENSHKTPYNGSNFYTYFYGETIGTKDAIVGLAVIEPNHEIHPPHQHAEEEYLYIIEGSGIWTLNGVKRAAKAGDVLYVAPWDMHGIFNTGNTPMKFFITRASSKGIVINKPSQQAK